MKQTIEMIKYIFSKTNFSDPDFKNALWSGAFIFDQEDFEKIGVGSRVHMIFLSEIGNSGDFVAALTHIQETDVVVIVHDRPLGRKFYALLLEILKGRKFTVTLGSGPSAKDVTIDLPRFGMVQTFYEFGSVPRGVFDACPLRVFLGESLGLVEDDDYAPIEAEDGDDEEDGEDQDADEAGGDDDGSVRVALQISFDGFEAQALKGADLSDYQFYIEEIVLPEEYDSIELFDFEQGELEWIHWFNHPGEIGLSASGEIKVDMLDEEYDTISAVLDDGETISAWCRIAFRIDGDSDPLERDSDYRILSEGSVALVSISRD